MKAILIFLSYCVVRILTASPAAAQVPDWENPAIFERNQTPPHAPMVPYAALESALARDRDSCPFFASLNGTWKFHWAEVPEKAPDGFYRPGFDVSDWDNVVVPGNWQMQGFGHALFRNISHPFPADPPRVPDDYNPVGSYRRTFLLPESWSGRRILLRFEGVKSASTVWINGAEVGYNEGGMEPAEYDITPFVRAGENVLAVRVIRFSDGTYLEDQDMWRLAGIYRDVTLCAVPSAHIRDYYVTTDLDADYVDAQLDLTVELFNSGDDAAEGMEIRAQLYDADVKPVPDGLLLSGALDLDAGETVELQFSKKITAPEKWSAESPCLYQLAVELLDADGGTAEVIAPRIGFRELAVGQDGAFLINGVPVKFNGVNSHVHHPETGRTMDAATMRRDLILMKQFNVNCVRTSHYPPNIEYLELADELGMYIVDETGDEAHATTYLSERPEWRAAYVDRARKMVYRDRNHPCVVIWSAGNESGSGENICALIAEGKRIDPSRPAWLYGGNNDYFPGNNPLDCEDIVGPRYPTPFELRTRIGQEPPEVDPRPSFMDEYVAVTGNSGGGLDEFWEVIERYPRCIGGAIWDWVSPGVKRPVRLSPDCSPLRNDGALMGNARLTATPTGGRYGRALELSGHDEWVELYRDPSLDITGDALTLDLWVYPRSWNGTSPFVTKGNNQFGVGQTSADTLEFYLYTDRRFTLRAAAPQPWTGSWHHLAAIYDGETMALYIDEEKIGSREAAGGIANTPFPVNIGRNAELHGQEHPGQLCNALFDRVRIFPAVLDIAGLQPDDPKLAARAVLWLDFERIEERGDFYSTGIGGRTYGLIWPDRRPQPELHQVKKAGQPVRVEPLDLSRGELRVLNRHLFTPLSRYSCAWEFSGNGSVLQGGSLGLSTPPQSAEIVRIPVEPFEVRDGVEYHLTLSFALPGSAAWAPAGHEIAFAQFELPGSARDRTAQPLSGANREAGPVRFEPPGSADMGEDAAAQAGALNLEESDSLAVLTGRRFGVTFDKGTGRIVSLRYDGLELITTGPVLNVWRAPLANELDQWTVGRARLNMKSEIMGEFCANDWYAAGLDRLEERLDSFQITRLSGREVEVAAVMQSMAEGGAAFDHHYRYRVLESGDILLSHRVTPEGPMPYSLPKVGLQMKVPLSMDRLQWYGRGPFETYPDRKSGARVAIHQGTVAEQYVPYLIPQDYGNKTDVRWLAVTDSGGVGLFFSGGELFNFSAQMHDTGNLTRALYAFQLERAEAVTLNLDHAVCGVGGTAISVLNKYRVYPEQKRYSLRIRPFSAAETEPEDLYLQDVW